MVDQVRWLSWLTAHSEMGKDDVCQCRGNMSNAGMAQVRPAEHAHPEA